jgi:hypothetical protein
MTATVVIATKAKQIMSKRLVVKMAVAITALSAVTLLSGCGEDDGFVIGAAWAPVGFVPAFGTAPTYAVGSTSGGGQAATGGSGGGATAAAAGARGGGGGGVSTGGAVQ